jgi:hypothetical protein
MLDHETVTEPTEFERKLMAPHNGAPNRASLVLAREEKLRQEYQVKTLQRELLARRAAFLSVELDDIERQACARGQYDHREYNRMATLLHVVLSKLGRRPKR